MRETARPTSRVPRTRGAHDAGRFRSAFRAIDLRLHPELELFAGVDERKRAMRRAALGLSRERAFYGTLVLAAVLSVTLTLGLRRIAFGLALPLSPLTIKLLLAVPVMVVCCGLAPLLLKRVLARRLRVELLDKGVPVCLGCGYHLAGLDADHPHGRAETAGCPECGRAFDERVRGMLTTRTPPGE